MTTTKTRTETETATILSVRIKPGTARRGWCLQCGAEVVWIVLPVPIEQFAVSEIGAIHRYGDEICLPSLIAGIGK